MAYAHRLRVKDNINTDYIISSKYKLSLCDETEMAKHIFESIDPDFAESLQSGDFIVAGSNFGCGSSREQAPLALKASGVKAIIARSYSRIFYRNAFNVGLCLIECETNYIDDMDEIELDMDKNRLRNNTKGVDVEIKPISTIMKKFLQKGGVIECFKENGGLDTFI